jgi:AcrR family transcriptional regulator
MTGRVRTRAADETRQKILGAAFEEFYRRGFQAGSVDAIVASAGVTKGALYHHFPDKAALGYAVVEEVVREPLLAAYLEPLAASEGDPLAALQATLRRRADDFVNGGIEFGCPLNNFAQEMSPLDEEFRARVAGVLEAWTEAFAAALESAQQQGFMRSDADARRIAAFLVASIEGSFGMAKNAVSVAVLRSNLDLLADFLETLRPRP